MEILTENNAFQNIGKCLQGKEKCDDQEQIEDFLQYCIQTIFYEKTYIVGIVPPDVIRDSREVINLLKDKSSKYLKEDTIEFEYLDDNSVKANEFVKKVSELLNNRLETYFETYKKMSTKELLTYFPKLSKKTKEMIKIATEAIKKNEINFLSRESELSKFSIDSGHYRILNHNQDIYKKIFAFANEFGWNDAMTLSIMTELRILSNRELAKINKKIFLPSIKRGRKDYLNRLIPKKVDSIIAEAGYIIGNFDMPSIRDLIIERGQSSPEEMLKITYDFRNEFTPIREYLKEFGNSSMTDSISTLNEISNKILEKIKYGPPYKRKRIFENTYTFSYGVGPANATATVPDKQTIDRINKLDRCVEVFTEVIDNILGESTSIFEKKLLNNCLKN